jgi:hypothetical protein
MKFKRTPLVILYTSLWSTTVPIFYIEVKVKEGKIVPVFNYEIKHYGIKRCGGVEVYIAPPFSTSALDEVEY